MEASSGSNNVLVILLDDLKTDLAKIRLDTRHLIAAVNNPNYTRGAGGGGAD